MVRISRAGHQDGAPCGISTSDQPSPFVGDCAVNESNPTFEAAWEFAPKPLIQATAARAPAASRSTPYLSSANVAKAGKPLVKVVALNAPEPGQVKRIGFLKGQVQVPDDFDSMGRKEIEQLFGREP